MENLAGKKLAAFVCEAGNGGEKALDKLGSLIDPDENDVFDAAAIFIDPKDKPAKDNDEKVIVFCQKLEG
jgi:hypothetical protein